MTVQTETTAAALVQASTPAAPETVKTATAALAEMFKEEIAAGRVQLAAAIHGGINAVAYSAILCYRARLPHINATRAQLSLLLLGSEKPKESDSGAAKIFRAAIRLAGFWQMEKALPALVATANSTETAAQAALDWLTSQGATSIDKMHDLVTVLEGDETVKTPKREKPLSEKFSAAIVKARKDHAFAIVDARETGKAMVKAMGMQRALAFLEAAKAVYDDMAKAKADQAAIAAAKGLGVVNDAPNFQTPDAEAALKAANG